MATIPLMYAEEDVEYGGKESISDDFAFNNNVAKAHINIRMGEQACGHFISSVECILDCTEWF